MPSGSERKVTIKIPGGSSTKTSSRSNHSRDSGIGSSSSRGSSGIRPDYYHTAPAGEDYQSNMSPHSVEEALQSAYDEIRYLKHKCVEVDGLLISSNKKLREAEAHYRAESDHSKEVDLVNASLKARNQKVEEDNDLLRDRINLLEEELRLTQSRRSKSSTPTDDTKLRGGSAPKRRDSHKGKDKGRAKEDPNQRERLSSRFQSKETTALPSRPAKRRDSYVEPLGPAVSRSFPRVETTRHQPANMSDVMMNPRPSDVSYGHGRYDAHNNDGSYQFRPINH